MGGARKQYLKEQMGNKRAQAASQQSIEKKVR